MRRFTAAVGALPILATLFIALACLTGGCSDSKPTQSPPIEQKDYAVYMREGMNPGWIFAYHPTTNKIDSFYWLTEGNLQVSADGSRLYSRPVDSSNVAAVYLDSIECGDTLKPDYSLPFTTVIAVSPDGQLLAVKTPENGFSIVQTSDLSVVVRDTALVSSGRFSSDSRWFHGTSAVVAGGDLPYGLAVEVYASQSPIERWSCPFGSLRRLVSSEDRSLWYLYVKISPFFDFEFIAYDPAVDSVLYRQHLTPGYGEIELGPDSSTVFFTNAGRGCISSGPYPPPFFHVYDPETNTADDTVWTIDACAEPQPISQMEFTPDGKWLVAIHNAFGVILTYDARTLEFKHCRILGNNYCLRSLVTQKMP